MAIAEDTYEGKHASNTPDVNRNLRIHRRGLERNKWYNGDRAYVVGHRGARGYCPENTLPSFSRAIEIGVDACECDVHLTKDAKIVVIHDDDLSRTTFSQGKIADIDSAHLRTIDAGIKFSPEFRNTRIPFLSELIDLIKGKVFLVCEIKGGIGEIEQLLVEQIKRKQFEESTVYISFITETLKNIRSVDPDAITMLLKAPEYEKHGEDVEYLPYPLSLADEADSLDVDALNLFHASVTAEIVQRAHAHGFKVYAWVVNSTKQAQRLIDFGIDGIGSDYPDRILKALQP